MDEKIGTDDILPFYSKNSPFSQFYPCKFSDVVDGNHLTFNCTEQYMMYIKTRTFHDTKTAKLIMKETSPLQIKKLGRQVRPFDDKIWNGVAEIIVRRGNMLKFIQNKELAQILMATGKKILAEASPRDRKWGVGLGVKNPKIYNQSTWRGKNLLGFILMKVREDLMNGLPRDGKKIVLDNH